MNCTSAERGLAGPFRPAADARERRLHLFGLAMGMGWLLIPIVSTATSSPAVWRGVLAGTLFPLACAAYLHGAEGPPACRPRREALGAIALITAIGVVLTVVVDPTWAILFTYVAVISGIHLPARWALPTLFALVALTAGLNWHEGADVALSFAISTLGVGALMLALGQLIAANAALSAAQAQIRELAVEAERERFARDLHDLLGHSLSVIALKAELAGRLLPDRPQEARRHVAELEGVARAALGEVRDTVSGYRRPTLAGELAGARIALDAAGIELRVDGHHDADGDGLPADVEAVLAWAVREGTTNVIRHSGARRCEIAIGRADGAGANAAGANGAGPNGAGANGSAGAATANGASRAASAEVRDDGGGESNGAAGHGLDGLRERAALVDGRVEAGAVPGGGFRLRVTVPLPAEDAA